MLLDPTVESGSDRAAFCYHVRTCAYMATPLSLGKTLQPVLLLSDETRAYLLILLAKHKKGLCVQDLALKVGVSHSAMCHQLAKLERLKIVAGTRKGQSVIYALTKNPTVKHMTSILKVVRAL